MFAMTKDVDFDLSNGEEVLNEPRRGSTVRPEAVISYQ